MNRLRCVFQGFFSCFAVLHHSNVQILLYFILYLRTFIHLIHLQLHLILWIRQKESFCYYLFSYEHFLRLKVDKAKKVLPNKKKKRVRNRVLKTFPCQKTYITTSSDTEDSTQTFPKITPKRLNKYVLTEKKNHINKFMYNAMQLICIWIFHLHKVGVV